MTLQRWEPFREMESLRDAIDRLFQESFVRPSAMVMPAGQVQGAFSLDLADNPEHFGPGLVAGHQAGTCSGHRPGEHSHHPGREEGRRGTPRPELAHPGAAVWQVPTLPDLADPRDYRSGPSVI